MLIIVCLKRFYVSDVVVLHTVSARQWDTVWYYVYTADWPVFTPMKRSFASLLSGPISWSPLIIYFLCLIWVNKFSSSLCKYSIWRNVCSTNFLTWHMRSFRLNIRLMYWVKQGHNRLASFRIGNGDRFAIAKLVNVLLNDGEFKVVNDLIGLMRHKIKHIIRTWKWNISSTSDNWGNFLLFRWYCMTKYNKPVAKFLVISWFCQCNIQVVIHHLADSLVSLCRDDFSFNSSAISTSSYSVKASSKISTDLDNLYTV